MEGDWAMRVRISIEDDVLPAEASLEEIRTAFLPALSELPSIKSYHARIGLLLLAGGTGKWRVDEAGDDRRVHAAETRQIGEMGRRIEELRAELAQKTLALESCEAQCVHFLAEKENAVTERDDLLLRIQAIESAAEEAEPPHAETCKCHVCQARVFG